MRRTRRTPIDQLRTAIDCLPPDTRVAMLEGVRSHEIIVGAYTDRRGGVCPMLAAHRCGGRTSFIGFAKAWDRFTRAGARSRHATSRELEVLTTHLEASILAAGRDSADLEAAIADHRALTGRVARPGDPDRSRELAGRPGSAWLRPFRRYDEYAGALARVEAQAARAAAEDRDPAGV